MRTIMITGHRPDKFGPYGSEQQREALDVIRGELLLRVSQACSNSEIIDNKPQVRLISGMALGVDQAFAQVGIALGLDVIAAIPFKGQERVWPAAAQDYYHSLLANCAEQHIVCEGGYAGWKMQKRNEWMVDHATEHWAVWDGKESGGTYNCVRYMKGKDIEFQRIWPFDDGDV